MDEIKLVNLSKLHDFENHPFKVEENTELCELMRSIENEGVLVPLLVRPNPNGDGYELISGHRRKAACVWAGVKDVPVVIRDLDDNQVVIAMVDSNLQREHIKPSEKAFAYKMKLEAMNRQGTDITSVQVEPKLETMTRSNELLANQVGESVAQIKRYVRLTKLIPKIHDVVKMLERTYHMNVRLKGNTISYSLPYRSINGGKSQAVRGSKLGKRFTVAGIKDYMKQKEKENWFEYPRQEQDIEHSSQSMKDYSRWKDEEEDEKEVKELISKTKKSATASQEPQLARKPDITPYEAYDEFQEKHEIPENDDTIFYGSAFDDFNKEWQGMDTNATGAVPDKMKTFPAPSEYRKLSLEERAKLLPPPSDDRMEELSKYQDRMGYTEEAMRSIRYKMSVFDDFNEEYDYRVKYNREHPSKEQTSMQEQTESQIAQEEQQPVIPPRRRGRGR